MTGSARVSAGDGCGAGAAVRVMDPELEAHIEIFLAYSRRYCANGSPDVANHELKRDHSLRVLDNAEAIVRGQGMAGDLARGCLLGALYHDVGRFEQYRRFGTFRDPDSANHGLLGAAVLAREGFLDNFPGDLRRMVRTVVALHNRLDLPRGLGGASLEAVKAVRDADKLDIYAVMLDHFRPDTDLNPVVLLGLADEPKAHTPSVLADVRAGLPAHYQDMRYVNDFMLLLASWVYGLNFPISRKLMAERGLLDRLTAMFPDIPEFDGLADKLARDLESGTHPGHAENRTL